MIDTHSHIDMIEQDATFLVKEAKDFGVEKIIVPSADRSSYEKVISLCNQFEEVYGALGVHPSEVLKAKDEDYEIIKDLVKVNKKIVAVGEIGLDYYWDKTFINEQKDAFKRQIKIAQDLSLPVLNHDRDAHFDSFEILKEIKDIPVKMHCFSGGLDFAKECIKCGFFIAIGGVVTFKNAKKMKEVAKEIPLDYLLLETYAPYLTPEPFRGKENHPAYVKYVTQEIANLRGISFEQVEEVTNQNAKRIFKF